MNAEPPPSSHRRAWIGRGGSSRRMTVASNILIAQLRWSKTVTSSSWAARICARGAREWVLYVLGGLAEALVPEDRVHPGVEREAAALVGRLGARRSGGPPFFRPTYPSGRRRRRSRRAVGAPEPVDIRLHQLSVEAAAVAPPYLRQGRGEGVGRRRENAEGGGGGSAGGETVAGARTDPSRRS